MRASTRSAAKSTRKSRRQKIKDKNDERFKSLSRDLEEKATVLIGIVTGRQWQIDENVEKCLQYLLKAKKNSPEAAKR